MASKRRVRRKSCAGKRRHETLEQAQKYEWDGMVAYYCSFCGGYHTGHKLKTNSLWNRQSNWGYCISW